MKLDLKIDGTYSLEIQTINTNTGKDYHDRFYLIPMETHGKWFVKRGRLFMSMKTTDTFCSDGQTTFDYNHIFYQDHLVSPGQFARARRKYERQIVKVACEGQTMNIYDHYSCYEFTRLKDKRLALDVRIGADFYEVAWTGEGTYLVKE